MHFITFTTGSVVYKQIQAIQRPSRDFNLHIYTGLKGPGRVFVTYHADRWSETPSHLQLVMFHHIGQQLPPVVAIRDGNGGDRRESQILDRTLEKNMRYAMSVIGQDLTDIVQYVLYQSLTLSLRKSFSPRSSRPL